MNVFILSILRILPLLTLTFTVLVFCITVYIDNTNSNFIIFVLMSLEVYINWIAIFLTSYTNSDSEDSRITNSTTHKNNSVVLDLNPVTSYMKYGQTHDYSRRWNTFNKSTMYKDVSPWNVDIRKIWYCSKCLTNTTLNCHHCPLCNRCIIHRDHHCLFLGACICLKNVGNFIVLCMYVGLVSMYVDFRLFPHLYEHFEDQEGTITLWNLSTRCFFPVALGKWLAGQEDFLFLSFVALFDILVSTSIFTFGFGMYHLYLAVTGQSHARMNGSKEYHVSHSKVSLKGIQNNFTTIFGKWGAFNFIFPIVLLRKVLRLKYFRRESKYN